MCGIFGYIGNKDAVEESLKGLKKVEYRGYDSAGIAIVGNEGILTFKEVGKIAQLEQSIEVGLDSHVAISHTRWATHGKPSKVNSHPHLDTKETLAVVHNGIIENYSSIKASLKAQGVVFVSDTDTEVIAQLIAQNYRGDVVKAIQLTLEVLEGSFAVALVHKDHPDEIYLFAVHAPLCVALGNNECWVSSDPNAVPSAKKSVIFLKDHEIAVVKREGCFILNDSGALIQREGDLFEHEIEEVNKGEYEHFTLKEIHEQPQAVRNILYGRLLDLYGTVSLDGVHISTSDLIAAQAVIIIGCGSSWHAGLIGARMIEEEAGVLTHVEISSEFRYQNPIVLPNTLVIAISQSGETADTLAAMRELRAKGSKVIALCNVPGSSIAREADGLLLLKAGAEIGVCSTKAFTNQVVALQLFALLLARARHMTKTQGQVILEALENLPRQIEAVLSKSEEIRKIAKKYAHYNQFFYLGRRYMYPVALEGALKLKEISYINANGYPAGEMKHGPIALIDETCPTVAFLSDRAISGKMISNLMEVKARSGKIIAVVFKGMSKELDKIADEIVEIPETLDCLAAVPAGVVAQLLAYYIALERGADIDQPRNLAKSVTVE